MSIFSLIGKVASAVFGSGAAKKIAKVAPAVAAGALTGAAGAAVGGLVGPGGKRRRRARKRITDRELQELIMLKAVVGTRSPLLTIAGIKMLSRGG